MWRKIGLVLACGGVLAMVEQVPGADDATLRAKLPAVEALPVRSGLPDVLTMFDGSPVRTKEDWLNKRRPELKTLFQHYMYGYFPPPPKIEVQIARVDEKFFGGKATKREVTITFGPQGTPPIDVLLIVPNKRTGPAPAFIGLNFCGNHLVVKDPSVALPRGWVPDKCTSGKDHRASELDRGREADNWAVEQTIDRGYALATFYHGDLDPDRNDFTDGVHPHFFAAGQKQPRSQDWGAIAAWAWGFHRVVDVLVTQSDIDAKRIAVVGHSRNGKTALLAGAFDERIALVIPHQAGCGGTAPSRGKIGESVERINTSFPHWFNDEFPKFNQQVDKLPFDQHSLIALCAPRPVLLSNAVEDSWANPDGQFEMLLAADKTYRLLGVEGVAAQERPPLGKLLPSRLGYYIRAGKHSMTAQDWQVFLEFADRNLK